MRADETKLEENVRIAASGQPVAAQRGSATRTRAPLTPPDVLCNSDTAFAGSIVMLFSASLLVA